MLSKKDKEAVYKYAMKRSDELVRRALGHSIDETIDDPDLYVYKPWLKAEEFRRSVYELCLMYADTIKGHEISHVLLELSEAFEIIRD